MKEFTQFAPAEWQNVSQCFCGWLGRHPDEKQDFQEKKKGNSSIRNGCRENRTGFELAFSQVKVVL